MLRWEGTAGTPPTTGLCVRVGLRAVAFGSGALGEEPQLESRPILRNVRIVHLHVVEPPLDFTQRYRRHVRRRRSTVARSRRQIGLRCASAPSPHNTPLPPRALATSAAFGGRVVVVVFLIVFVLQPLQLGHDHRIEQIDACQSCVTGSVTTVG